MKLQSKQRLQCFMLFLLLHFNLSKANAAAYAQFKREQQQPTLQQQKSQQQQQQQQLQQQHTQIQAPGMPNLQNPQEKDAIHQTLMKHANPTDSMTDFGDPYQMMNELKQETRASPPLPAASMPWHPNPYMNQAIFSQPQFPATPYAATTPFTSSFGATTPMFESPKFFPFIGFPQPMFIPFPLFYAPAPTPEMMYSMFPGSMNNFEDTMSRAAGGRRPSTSHARDSPIYYMRLPPTPYMFLPNFGYTTASPNFGAGFSSFSPYHQPFTAFSGLSPTFNLPLNFIANGKPSGIYQMTSPPQNDLQNPFIGFNNFNARPSPSPAQANFNGNYALPSYGLTTQPSSPPLHDSRMTLLKNPFIFNGRPEEVFILQNNLSPMFGGI